MLQLAASRVNKIIGIILFSLLAAGSALAQSQTQSPHVYTDRATWLKAVTDAGIMPEIGTQTFEGYQVGLYHQFMDVGGVSYGGSTSEVSVAQLISGGHVLRPDASAGINADQYLGGGYKLYAIAFDFSIEANLLFPQCGTPTSAEVDPQTGD